MIPAFHGGETARAGRTTTDEAGPRDTPLPPGTFLFLCFERDGDLVLMGLNASGILAFAGLDDNRRPVPYIGDLLLGQATWWPASELLPSRYSVLLCFKESAVMSSSCECRSTDGAASPILTSNFSWANPGRINPGLPVKVKTNRNTTAFFHLGFMVGLLASN